MRQRWLLWAGIGLCVLTVFSELYLRFDGYKCEGDAGYLYRYEGFDPYLGWRNRIGHNKSSEYTDINPCYENVWPDGSRVSRRDRDKKALNH